MLAYPHCTSSLVSFERHCKLTCWRSARLYDCYRVCYISFFRTKICSNQLTSSKLIPSSSARLLACGFSSPSVYADWRNSQEPTKLQQTAVEHAQRLGCRFSEPWPKSNECDHEWKVERNKRSNRLCIFSGKRHTAFRNDVGSLRSTTHIHTHIHIHTHTRARARAINTSLSLPAVACVLTTLVRWLFEPAGFSLKMGVRKNSKCGTSEKVLLFFFFFWFCLLFRSCFNAYVLQKKKRIVVHVTFFVVVVVTDP